MKKIIAALLALITLFAVLGCQNAGVTKTAEPTQTPETTKAQEPDPAPTATPEIPKPSKSEDPRPVRKVYTLEEERPSDARNFEADKVCDDGEPLDISLYTTEDIIFYNYSVVALGMSADALITTMKMRDPPNSMYNLEMHFPNAAWRKLENGYAYAVMDGTDGTRLYARYHYVQTAWEMEWRACGYPIYCKKAVSYSDFADIKVGDTSQRVAEVDPITNQYIRSYSAESEENIEAMLRLNNPLCSVHLLTDGILKFTYERTKNKEGYLFTITDIEYHDDYIMEAAGVTVDYSVADIDRIS